MYGRTGGLERFKKAQTLQPFAVATKQTTTQLHSESISNHQQQQQQEQVCKDVVVNSQVGGGESSWQPPDWAIEPRHGVYYLDVLKDGQLLDKINLDKRRHIFGRQFHTCDFVLDHQSVSRQHAAVVPHKNGSIYVIDLGSAHGTFVANERLIKDSPVELEVGQSLRFAASTRVYILKKNNSALFPPQPTTINLPPPPDPSDEEAVLAYNTFLNRYNNNNNDLSQVLLGETRPVKRRKKGRVAFKDQVGGELVEVVGVSDGADVETEPGPIGVKEGSSLVGKYESLVQTKVIPRGGGGGKMESGASPKGGVTDKLQQVLNRVKASSKGSAGGIYDGIYGESLSSSKVASSWAYSGGREEEKSPAAAASVSASAIRPESNVDYSDDDDDLFG